MTIIDSDSKVDLLFQLKWKSGNATHTDCYQAIEANIWRDIFPPTLRDRLMGAQTGDNVVLAFSPGQVVSHYDAKELHKIRSSQFRPARGDNPAARPHVGRFYPQGVLKDVTGVFKDNITPFRCVAVNNEHLSVDFNHPLSDKALHLSTIVGKIEPKRTERGGTSIDWIERLTQGPGMQARWREVMSDFLTPSAFERHDAQTDAGFYAKPRLVEHLDSTAASMVKNTYDRFLDDGMQVLDLMSSWQSHLPERHRLERVVGLGLNADELKRNPQLTEHVVHDLNANSRLPFESDAFDVVLCTVSVEYLIDPLTVFNAVARVLKPGGYFVVTFSNRWFPTKAIQIWPELHEFERMGLVLEYFLRTEKFGDLHTYSMRGLPRPHDDKYFGELVFSDPVYAVWGRKPGLD